MTDLLQAMRTAVIRRVARTVMQQERPFANANRP